MPPPRFVALHACDKSDVCKQVLKCHKHPPQHLHGDLNDRLSKTALDGLDEAESWAEEQLQQIEAMSPKPPNEKELRSRVGEQLLSKFMSVLSRPGSFLAKAYCHLSTPAELHFSVPKLL